MAQTLDWFDRYLADHPEVELVYRRHPSEWNSPALDELARKRPNFHVIFADSVKQWIVAADSISIWMSTAVAEVYMAGKSCHILRPVPIEHEYDPVIYRDARYVTSYQEFTAAMADPEPPFPIQREVIEGYFDPSPRAAYLRMADLLEDVYKNPPRDHPMGPGFHPHFNLLSLWRWRGCISSTAQMAAQNRVCPLPAAGRFRPADLRLCGQGLCLPGGGGAHDRPHPSLCAGRVTIPALSGFYRIARCPHA